MNRREILFAALSAPVLTMSLPALAATRRITWEPGTYSNQHALMVARNLNQLLRDKVIYTTGEFLGNKIPLTDPTFRVQKDDIIWHSTRGFRYHDSLQIEVRERGVLIGITGLFSTADYEEYWNSPKPDHYPDFGIKAIHNPYETYPPRPRLIRDAVWEVVETRPDKGYVTTPDLERMLGRKAVDVDDRWMKRWIKEHEEAKEMLS